MNERVRRFRQVARAENRGRTGRAIRYSERLREDAVTFARHERSRGRSLSAIARDLGVAPNNVARWVRSARTPRFEKVVVTRAGVEAGAAAVSPVMLTTASGHRVEGLDLAGLVAVLRALS